MSNLTTSEKIKLEKLFGMDSGYVLDFSHRTFNEFFWENGHINIFDEKYNYASGSKANRLRAFWIKEENKIVGMMLRHLIENWRLKKEISNQVITLAEKALSDDCIMIADRLISNKPTISPGKTVSQTVDQGSNKDYQLAQLLTSFDALTISTDYQKRGYLLQDLFHRLFGIHGIPVTKSFLRNQGGEQIDGAFTFNSWHYLVECKWTKKLTDIKELDNLLAKVNRGGKQAMGLFLSMEGYSINVPNLLKQNPEKCIILMDGYDLRSVLCGAVSLEKLLNAKLAKLNNDSEPFISAIEIMKG